MIRRLARETWPVALLLVSWQLWASHAGFNRIVFVTPAAVLRDLAHAPGAYLAPALHTLVYALGGLALGMFAGVTLAAGSELSELLAGMTRPLAAILSSTPVVCMIPLLARLFGHDSRSELTTIAVMTFFPCYLYGGRGLREWPRLSDEVFRSLAASRTARLRLLSLPAAMPAISSALRLGASVSVLVALVTEYLMQVGGLGTLFAVTMQKFDIPRALGASLIAMALSVLLYELGCAVESGVHRHYRG